MKVWFRWFSRLPNALLFTPNLKDLLICKNLGNLLSILSLNVSAKSMKIHENPFGSQDSLTVHYFFGFQPFICQRWRLRRPHLWSQGQERHRCPSRRLRLRPRQKPRRKMIRWRTDILERNGWMLGLSERMSWMSLRVFLFDGTLIENQSSSWNSDPVIIST